MREFSPVQLYHVSILCTPFYFISLNIFSETLIEPKLQATAGCTYVDRHVIRHIVMIRMTNDKQSSPDFDHTGDFAAYLRHTDRRHVSGTCSAVYFRLFLFFFCFFHRSRDKRPPRRRVDGSIFRRSDF